MSTAGGAGGGSPAECRLTAATTLANSNTSAFACAGSAGVAAPRFERAEPTGACPRQTARMAPAAPAEPAQSAPRPTGPSTAWLKRRRHLSGADRVRETSRLSPGWRASTLQKRVAGRAPMNRMPAPSFTDCGSAALAEDEMTTDVNQTRFRSGSGGKCRGRGCHVARDGTVGTGTNDEPERDLSEP